MPKILIVDDEPNIRRTLGSILEDEGHKIIVCESGEEAITHFARDEFDLAILDLWLPGIDGLSVLERLKTAGAPPVPAFYAKPQSLEEMIDHTLGRALDLFGFDTGTVRRWGEAAENAAPPTRSPSPAPRERVARPKGRAG